MLGSLWLPGKRKDKLKMVLCNLSSSNISSSTFYKLHYTCNEKDTTCNSYNITAGVSFLLFTTCFISWIITCVKFNSVTVLNLRVRPTAISNIFWILYFCILAIRSLLLGIVYIDHGHIFLHFKRIPKILFPLENFFKILEVLFFSWSLEYQRKHRSKGFIQDEIQRFNDDRSEDSTSTCKSIKKLLKTTYNIFTAQALVCLAFLVVFTIFLLENKKDYTDYLYWTYNGCVWSLCVSCIVLVVIIVIQRTINDGPSTLTKVLLSCGVVLTLPADIPLFIWQHCIFQESSSGPVGYIASQALMIIAVVMFMVVLKGEFLRLKEEAQWNIIDQAESYYNFTESM